MFEKRKRLDSHYLTQLSRDIDPDEIFLDATNLPNFDKDQFEGRMEKPIGKGAIIAVALVFLFIELGFLAQAANLQILQGDYFFSKSERNRLEDVPIFAMRGNIYDRTQTPLVWNAFDASVAKRAVNATTTKETSFARREYIAKPGFGHILGYVSYPKRDSKGNYYQERFHGVDGVEEWYDSLLEGKNGRQLVEEDALGNIQSDSIVEEPQNGATLTLGVDARVQEKFYTTIRALAEEKGYSSGAGAIMDVENGELLALASFPEYESSVLSDGADKKTIQGYLTDKRLVFLDRAVSGVYTPGSIVKPIMAIAALNEGLIDPKKQILSTGSISIQNPYNPELKSIFNDWKAHGWVNMQRAIAVSSDVYFYAIGGGFEDQRGLGISNIEKYARMFGFGRNTGVDLVGEKLGTVPNPAWKAGAFGGEAWRLGDTYHTVIGQYGFQVTPLQAVRAIGAIANGGTLVTPHLVREPAQKFSTEKIAIPKKYFDIVREGMRDAVTEGTVSGLSVGYVKVAGKTGTAEIDAGKKYINSWVVGFFPYDKPRYAFVVVMERGPYQNSIGGVYVMRQMFDWMSVNTPEYLE
ncbi:MAG: penicillin-binding transpeptidase domain-containing protein [Patescibacteria group bacterium]